MATIETESKLSSGAIAAIIRGAQPNAPVVQVTRLKRMHGNSNLSKHFRLMISDGAGTHQYCLAPEDCVTGVGNGAIIDQWAVIKLIAYSLLGDSARPVILMSKLELIRRGSDIRQRLSSVQTLASVSPTILHCTTSLLLGDANAAPVTNKHRPANDGCNSSTSNQEQAGTSGVIIPIVHNLSKCNNEPEEIIITNTATALGTNNATNSNCDSDSDGVEFLCAKPSVPPGQIICLGHDDKSASMGQKSTESVSTIACNKNAGCNNPIVPPLPPSPPPPPQPPSENLSASIVTSQSLIVRSINNASMRQTIAPSRGAVDATIGVPTCATINQFYQPRVVPINILSPFLASWALRGRVVSKSVVRNYSNARCSGKVFNFALADLSGEVKIVAFNGDCDKFYPRIAINRVLLVTRATIKTADRRYSKAEFEITLSGDSIVEDVTGALGSESVPSIAYNFTRIRELAHKEQAELVDVVGVLLEPAQVVTVLSRLPARELRKRTIVLADESLHTIGVTLWAAAAEQFAGKRGDIVVLRAAKVGVYDGCSLSASDTLALNPDLPEATSLRSWFQGVDLTATSLVHLTRDTHGGTVPITAPVWWTLSQLSDMERVRQITGSGQLVKCKITLLQLDDKLVYKCCPTNGCGKKLLQIETKDDESVGGGMFECLKCRQRSSGFKYRFKVDATIYDQTGNFKVTLWDDRAEVVVGVGPEVVGALSGPDCDGCPKWRSVVKNSVDFVMTFKPRIETYLGIERVCANVINVAPVNWTEYGQRLEGEIRALESGIVTTN